MSTCCFILSGGKGVDEAAENRNYLTSRMTDELHEIIRVLQLTTYDEDEWEADQLTAMKRANNAIQSKMRTAKDWVEVMLFWSQISIQICLNPTSLPEISIIPLFILIK